MLRLTRISDYGIVLMTRLASDRGDEARNARALAVEANLPLPVVSKVLKALARAGLLTSQRGIKGGYRLQRPATAISVAAIVEALEGPIAITECSAGGCEHESSCGVRDHWQRINEAVRGALEGLSLAEMTQPSPAELVHLSRRADHACDEGSFRTVESL